MQTIICRKKNKKNTPTKMEKYIGFLVSPNATFLQPDSGFTAKFVASNSPTLFPIFADIPVELISASEDLLSNMCYFFLDIVSRVGFFPISLTTLFSLTSIISTIVETLCFVSTDCSLQIFTLKVAF